MIEIIMPQGGQDINKGQVVRWLKDIGERVQKGDVLCEVETEKAMFEIESPADGFLRGIVVPAGQEAAILSVIGFVGDASETLPGDQQGMPAQALEQPEAKVAAPSAGQPAANAPHKISPRAMRIAEQQGISISELRGTGPGGRVLEKDVTDYISRRSPAPANLSGEAHPGGRLLTLDKRRKATAQKMAASKQNVPHFYVMRAVDMTDALAFREQLNTRLHLADQAEVSINDLIVRACALALKDFPQLNASFQDQDHILLLHDINVAVAVSLGESLMAAVVANADRLSLQETAKQTRDAIMAARNGRILSLAPATFTISNLGMYQVDGFVAIINSPEFGHPGRCQRAETTDRSGQFRSSHPGYDEYYAFGRSQGMRWRLGGPIPEQGHGRASKIPDSSPSQHPGATSIAASCRTNKPHSLRSRRLCGVLVVAESRCLKAATSRRRCASRSSSSLRHPLP